ncbi:hypothetical protein I4U23_019208 [Adineta vaga]|nr:hypothetical protein I4U23_019208 [Adineta vaga]
MEHSHTKSSCSLFNTVVNCNRVILVSSSSLSFFLLIAGNRFGIVRKWSTQAKGFNEFSTCATFTSCKMNKHQVVQILEV